MKKIRCLYMEDIESDFKLLSEVLKLTLRDKVELDITRAHDVSQAFDLLENYGSTYQMFIADLMFPDFENKLKLDGLIAVEKAVNYPHIAIVALSAADIKHDFDAATRNTGLYLDKDDIRQRKYPKEKLHSDLLKLLESKKHLADSAESLNKVLPWQTGKQLKLDALIETVGHENLVNLAKDAAPECERYEVHYVAPGYSGAVVLRVTGSKLDSRVIDANFLLKCSRDKAKLEIEMRRCPRPKEPSSIIYVLPEAEHLTDPPSVYHRNGWFASAWTFRDDAGTFLSWLTENGASRGKVEEIMSTLFVSGLNKDYRRGATNNVRSGVESLSPNVLGRFRISNSITHLKTLLQRTLRDPDLDIKEVELFLSDEVICGKPFNKVKSGTYECICHGDLHSRNILITERNQPLLIDPARRKTRNWATDPAKLCVDLWVTAWDFGPESYLWDQLVLWIDNIRGWLETRAINVSTINVSNSRTANALTWISNNLPHIFEGCSLGVLPDWEFRLALAVEFLNLSGYESVPTPKRCMAVIAANDILNKLNRENSIPFTT